MFFVQSAISLDFFPPLYAGVTAIRPEELEFPNTMTDIDYDTWMLRWNKYLVVLLKSFPVFEVSISSCIMFFCVSQDLSFYVFFLFTVEQPSCRMATRCATTTGVI